MVSIRKKIINGTARLYAEYSFRLPDGTIKKISKFLRKKENVNGKEVNEYFLQKEIEQQQKYALRTYSFDAVFTTEQIKKVEQARIEFRQILKKLSKKQLQDVIDRFTVNFTYESNAIEGNSLTLKDVTLLLTENKLPKNKDLREVYETRNMRQATQMLFDKKIKLTKKSIINLHKVVVQDTGVETGFKKIPNFLLMREVKTTPPEKTEDTVNELLDWFKKTKEHPLKVAAEFHARFEKIHPFEDGNGRVGRLLLNVILLGKGYSPLIIRKTARIAYLEGLAAFDKGHTRKLEQFILNKFKQTFEKFFKVYVRYL